MTPAEIGVHVLGARDVHYQDAGRAEHTLSFRKEAFSCLPVEKGNAVSQNGDAVNTSRVDRRSICLTEKQMAMVTDIEVTHEDMRHLQVPICDYLLARSMNPEPQTKEEFEGKGEGEGEDEEGGQMPPKGMMEGKK